MSNTDWVRWHNEFSRLPSERELLNNTFLTGLNTIYPREKYVFSGRWIYRGYTAEGQIQNPEIDTIAHRHRISLSIPNTLNHWKSKSWIDMDLDEPMFLSCISNDAELRIAVKPHRLIFSMKNRGDEILCV